MKKIFVLILLLSLFSCSNKFDKTLEGLSNNYVLLYEKMDKELYLDFFKLTKEEHILKVLEYQKAVTNFYESDKSILDYLLKFENDTSYCEWIKTKNPNSSQFLEDDIITKSKGALILFDNYLSNSSDIKVPRYLNSLSFDLVIDFYNKNKTLSLEGMKKEYYKLTEDL